MSDLTKYERLAIIVLMAALLLGLAIRTYKKSHPHIDEIAIGQHGIQKDADSEEEMELLIEPEKININMAGAETLCKLKGVGPVLADRIVDYRKSNGLFETIDDIKKVRGVGKTLFDKIRDRITTE